MVSALADPSGAAFGAGLPRRISWLVWRKLPASAFLRIGIFRFATSDRSLRCFFLRREPKLIL